MRKAWLALTAVLMLALWGTTVFPSYGAANGTAVFVQTADRVCGGSGANGTTLFGTGIGTRTIPAGSLKVGDVYTTQLWGKMEGTTGDTFALTGFLGATQIFSVSGGMVPATSATPIVFAQMTFTVISTGASGTVFVQGKYHFWTASANTGSGGQTVSTATVTVDTTQDLAFDMKGTYSPTRAANVWTTTNAWIFKNVY